MAATTVARLEAILSANTRDFDRGMDRSESKMSKAGKAAGVAGLAIAGGLAFGAKHAINSASDLNEQMNKTAVVFGKSGADVQKWSKGLTRNFGISSRAALEAAGTFGNMLVPMGIARVKAAGMSKQMVQLAGDMASFNNASPEATLEALRAGLAGETEPLRKFGIFLNQDRIAAEALALGLVKAEVDMAKVKLTQIALTEAQRDAAKALHEHGKGSLEYAKEAANLDYIESKLSKTLEGKIPKLTAAQKAQATYSIITKDTADAAGDFERTSGSLANQQRILRAEVENLSAQLGQNLLPIVVAVMNRVVRATVFFSEHKTATKALVIATAALTAALLAASAAQLALNLAVLANPYVAAAAAIIALAAGVALLWAKVEKLRPVIALVSFYVLGLPAGVTLLLAAFGKLNPVVEAITGAFRRMAGWLKTVKDSVKWLIENLGKIGGALGRIPGVSGGGGPSSSSSGLIPMVTNAVGAAREMGWNGVVTSGFRTYSEQAALYARYLAGGPLAAKPGTSSHEKGQAVDVTDYGTFGRMMNRLPVGLRLYNKLGARDPVHFSVTGYAKGGIVPGPIGAPQLAMVHGGETITPPGGDINLYVDGQKLFTWFRGAEAKHKRRNG